MAADKRYKNVKFASICCDSCDRARNVIEKDDSPRWGRVVHYYINHEYKEEVKKVLGFKQVPFYVVLDKEGEIVQIGSRKYIDFENLPGMSQPKSEGKSEGEGVRDKECSAFEILDLNF